MIRFVHRYLDPEESLVEILFGLVMALTMTAGARIFLEEDAADVTELVLALLGCNLAWGIIDGMFYLVGTRFGRNQTVLLARRLRRAQNEAEVLSIIESEIKLDEGLLPNAEDRAQLHRTLAHVLQRVSPVPARNTPRELIAAGIVCLLVTAAAFPGVLPLLLLPNAHTALVVANTLQVCLLFVIGYCWGKFAGAPQLRAGAAVALLGIALVALAVVLGG